MPLPAFDDDEVEGVLFDPVGFLPFPLPFEGDEGALPFPLSFEGVEGDEGESLPLSLLLLLSDEGP
jgi:hypothetical protein